MTQPMTAEQIQSRLAEIENEQAAFDSRDFDQELSQAIVNGGDVDTLEDQHLQAEKLARRLRVERQALEARLPEAQVAEARADLESARQQRDDLRPEAQRIADRIVDRLAELERDAQEWRALMVKVNKLEAAATGADDRICKVEGRRQSPVSTLKGFTDSRLNSAYTLAQSLMAKNPNMGHEDLASEAV